MRKCFISQLTKLKFKICRVTFFTEKVLRLKNYVIFFRLSGNNGNMTCRCICEFVMTCSLEVFLFFNLFPISGHYNSIESISSEVFAENFKILSPFLQVYLLLAAYAGKRIVM